MLGNDDKQDHCTDPGNCRNSPELAVLAEQMQVALNRFEKGEQRFLRMEETLDALVQWKAEMHGGKKLLVMLLTVLGTIAAIGALPYFSR